MVFNLVGYRWLLNSFEQKATARLEKKISAGSYSDDQLVEIKIPLNMPYFSDKDYEEVYGERDWNGQHYRYVKRKVSNNVLYLLCLPNTEKTNIANVKNEFTKAVNDVPGNNKGSEQKNDFVKLLTSKYRKIEFETSEAQSLLIHTQFIIKNSEVRNLFTLSTETQPPESV